MPKPKIEKRNPRLLKRGDVVRVRMGQNAAPVATLGRRAAPEVAEVDEVVREVSMIIHLTNGIDVHVPVDEDVDVVIENIPDLLAEQVANLQSE